MKAEGLEGAGAHASNLRSVRRHRSSPLALLDGTSLPRGRADVKWKVGLSGVRSAMGLGHDALGGRGRGRGGGLDLAQVRAGVGPDQGAEHVLSLAARPDRLADHPSTH